MPKSLPAANAFILCLMLVCAVAVQAQKLPNKQEMGLRAPANVKIDGKVTEWEPFQAFNHSTEIYYTVSNDDDNLYLAVHVVEPMVIGKVMGGGITMVIQRGDKKDDKDGISINYPVLDQTNRQNYILKRKNETPLPDNIAQKAGDSVMALNNSRFMTVAKTIKVKGIAGLDSLISIYNDDGIKAAGSFNNKKEFVCEMSIALKHLGMSVKDASKFNYHILLNTGSNKYTASALKVFSIRSPNGDLAPQSEVDDVNAKLSATMQAVYATTDFWGDYTLAKKL